MDKEMIKFTENDKMAEYLGMKLVKVEEGYALVKMEISDCHLNGVGMVHGGAIFALADYAFAVSSNSKGVLTVGINANISYFKSPEGNILTAEAKEITAGKKLCSYNVDIFDGNNDLVARFLGNGYIKNANKDLNK